MTLRIQAPEPALLTVDEAATYLRISRAKAYAMAATGELPTVRLGRSVRVRREKLAEFVDQRSSK